jgi:protein-S-isoprenylcysteine O-methyltransferase Ste14
MRTIGAERPHRVLHIRDPQPGVTVCDAVAVSRRIRRSLAVVVTVAATATAHGVVPVAVARTGARHRPTARLPGSAQLLGLVPLLAGAGIVGSALAEHYQHEHGSIAISLTPDYLLRGGPYRYSRNPMYVGEAGMWLGWSVLLGSPKVAVAAICLAAGMRTVVAREERNLARRFVGEWEQYAREVPRWLDISRHLPRCA